MWLYLKRSYAALTPVFFLPTFLSVHIFNMLFKQPILLHDAEVLEKVQKLALKFVKGRRHVPYGAALKQLRLYYLTHRRIRGDLISMFKITHGLLELPMVFTSNPQRATRPSQLVPPTGRLYAPSPICLHHSGITIHLPILEQIAG